MAGSHPQHHCSSCILILLCLTAPAMDGRGGASAAGSAAASDDFAFSPDLGDGERDKRDGAGPTPEGTTGTAAALASGTAAAFSSEVARPVKGGTGCACEPTASEQQPAAAGADVGKSMLEEIAQLKKQQKEVKDAKLAVGKQLRNAERRRNRLKKRANKLSDADLLAVISLRNHEKAVGGQGETATDEGDEENAKCIPGDAGASSSSAAPSKATTNPVSKKPRGS